MSYLDRLRKKFTYPSTIIIKLQNDISILKNRVVELEKITPLIPAPTTIQLPPPTIISEVTTYRNGESYILPMVTVRKARHPAMEWEVQVDTSTLATRILERELADR